MKINIKGKELELCFSIRTNIMYENVMGESLDWSQLNNVTKITQLFYCVILATMQKNKMPLDLTWDEYIEWIDDNGGYSCLNDFAIWLTHYLEVQFGISVKDIEEQKKKVTKTKK